MSTFILIRRIKCNDSSAQSLLGTSTVSQVNNVARGSLDFTILVCCYSTEWPEIVESTALKHKNPDLIMSFQNEHLLIGEETCIKLNATNF